jgi:hypothetical protein
MACANDDIGRQLDLARRGLRCRFAHLCRVDSVAGIGIAGDERSVLRTQFDREVLGRKERVETFGGVASRVLRWSLRLVQWWIGWRKRARCGPRASSGAALDEHSLRHHVIGGCAHAQDRFAKWLSALPLGDVAPHAVSPSYDRWARPDASAMGSPTRAKGPQAARIFP